MKPTRLTKRKLLLRKRLRQVLGSIQPRDRMHKSRTITAKITALNLFKKAGNVFTYVSLPSEVDTRGLIAKALRLKKNVYVPAVDAGSRKLSVYRIRNCGKDLETGFMNIPEPKRVKNRAVNPKELELAIIPGIGFDRAGGRLGRGAGYFDRFLKNKKRLAKIGIAFREQLIPKIPMEKNDIRMDLVVTD